MAKKRRRPAGPQRVGTPPTQSGTPSAGRQTPERDVVSTEPAVPVAFRRPPHAATTPPLHPVPGTSPSPTLQTPQTRPSPAEPPPGSTDTTARSAGASEDVEHTGVPPLRLGVVSCAPLVELAPQGIAATCWLDTNLATESADPYDVRVRLTGTRLDDAGVVTGDTFTTTQTFPGLLPHTGTVALSTRTSAIKAGTWQVHAQVDTPQGTSPHAAPRRTFEKATGPTGYLPALSATTPGVRAGVWPALVGTGAVIAVGLQQVFAAQRGLPTGRLLVLSLLACLLGLAGAKGYSYLTLPRGNRSLLTAGLCIQGFVLTAIAVMILGSAVLGVPIGAMLDVTTPGLLAAMALGRVGCFFAGCCSGRPTASRWGLWSTNRTVGTQRIPVQLLEAAFTAAIAAASLLELLTVSGPLRGLIFLAAISLYTFGRQWLFLLRSQSRLTPHGRTLVMATAGTVFVVAATLFAIG
ncbi:hypothetical protein GCM10027047_14080 [Rhodococcus aerolatus]